MNLGNVLDGVVGWITGTNNPVTNLLAKTTGSSLTGAEREANAFTAEREDLAWHRTMEADNTKYQRQVQDLHAAGLNPMLAVSGGVTAPAAHSSGSVSPSDGGLNLGSLLSFYLQNKLLPAQIKDLESSADLKSAQAEKAVEESRSVKMNSDFFESVREFRYQAEEQTPGLVRANARKIWKEIDVMDTTLTKNIEQAHSEQVKQELMLQQAILARAEAENIVYMRPFIQAELAARTQQEKAAAQLSAVHTAFQQGLIDNGAIEQAIRLTGAEISVREVKAALDSWSLSLKDGTYNVDGPAGKIVSSLYQGLNALTNSIVGGLHF